MCAQWNSKRESNSKEFVKLLLEPVAAQFVPDNRGGVAGMSISTYHEFSSSIESYVRLNKEIPVSEVSRLIGDAIWKAAGKGELNSDSFLECLTEVEKGYLKIEKKDYEFISSLSVKYFNRLNTDEPKSPVKFSNKLSGKYDMSLQLIRNERLGISQVPSDYSYFRIPVRARNIAEAHRIGFEEIDLLRAIWNWNLKPIQYIYTSDRPRPLNIVRMGPYHSILSPDKTISDDFWYELEFFNKSEDIENDWSNLLKFEKDFRGILNKHPYQKIIEDGLRKYAQALDYQDKNIAFLKLWQVLEKLTGFDKADYPALVRRVSFLFVENKLNEAVLNNLRHYRNLSMHDGKESPHIEKYLFQLRNFVELTIKFHLNNHFECKNFNETISCLDLPPNIQDLMAQKKTYETKLEQIKKGLSYRK